MVTKYVILIIYFLILFVIGGFAAKRIKGAKDYFVGGKNLGFWVVAFSSRATGESAWLLLGLTGMGALVGVHAFWVVLGELFGVTVAWLFMAKRFKRLSDTYNSITIPDYLVSRFGAKTHWLRILSAATLSIFVTIYVSAQIDAAGAAFETFLGWNYFVGAIVGFVIVAVYIVSGGFVAVAWSDLFQGLIMIIGLVALPLAGIAYIFSNPDIPNEVIGGLQAMDPDLLNVWGPGGFSGLAVVSVIGLLMIGIGYLGVPQVFVRFMSIKNEGEINKGRWVAIFYTLIADGAAVCIGMLGRYLLTDVGQDPALLGNGGQDVLPMMVEEVFPLVIIAIYIAAVLSAIMSTVDSLLVVASSAVTRDFYQQIFKPDLKEENMARISRVITVSLALFAMGIAMTVAILAPGRTVFWFVIFGWSGIAATFSPVMILSLFWKKYSTAGAIASMITGFLSVPLFKFVFPTLPVVGPYFEKLAELPPAFFMAMIAGVIFSLVFPQDPKTVPDLTGK